MQRAGKKYFSLSIRKDTLELFRTRDNYKVVGIFENVHLHFPDLHFCCTFLFLQYLHF